MCVLARITQRNPPPVMQAGDFFILAFVFFCQMPSETPTTFISADFFAPRRFGSKRFEKCYFRIDSVIESDFVTAPVVSRLAGHYCPVWFSASISASRIRLKVYSYVRTFPRRSATVSRSSFTVVSAVAV